MFFHTSVTPIDRCHTQPAEQKWDWVRYYFVWMTYELDGQDANTGASSASCILPILERNVDLCVTHLNSKKDIT